jgi:hypothetical protein
MQVLVDRNRETTVRLLGSAVANRRSIGREAEVVSRDALRRHRPKQAATPGRTRGEETSGTP